MNIKQLDKLEIATIGTFIAFFLIFIIGAIAPGLFLDRLVSYRNVVRRFLGIKDGFFFLTLIPFLVLIDVAYKGLIAYKPVSKAKKLSVELFLLGLIVALASAKASPNTNVTFNEPIVNHVIVITFDGTRADVFRKASSIADYFKSIGARAEYAISTYPTITYPSHTSIFTGTYAVVHGVYDNKYYEVKAETIFEVAYSYGLKSALVTPASTLANMLSKGGTVADVYTGDEYADMSKVTTTAEQLLSEGYNLMRLHYVESDDTGHLYGADSEQYRAVIAAEQNEVKKLIDRIQEHGLRNDTVIILTADHGMFVNKHHHIYPAFVDHVPFVIMGGKVKPMQLKPPSTIDIAPTVAMLLGIRVPHQAVGVAIGEPFGEPNVRCDTGSLRANEIVTALAVALLFTSLFVILEDRAIRKFFE